LSRSWRVHQHNNDIDAPDLLRGNDFSEIQEQEIKNSSDTPKQVGSSEFEATMQAFAAPSDTQEQDESGKMEHQAKSQDTAKDELTVADISRILQATRDKIQSKTPIDYDLFHSLPFGVQAHAFVTEMVARKLFAWTEDGDVVKCLAPKELLNETIALFYQHASWKTVHRRMQYYQFRANKR
jgi:hypothetical protein